MKTLKPNKQKLRGQIPYLRTFLALAALAAAILILVPTRRRYMASPSIQSKPASCLTFNESGCSKAIHRLHRKLLICVICGLLVRDETTLLKIAVQEFFKETFVSERGEIISGPKFVKNR